ncbi:MAG: hypothetical protein ACI8X3_002250 [Saprospiraceae bacterium]|jgi:hypothetical protein
MGVAQSQVKRSLALGFPSWIIYPSAILKVLGLLTIWSRISDFLKEWAYAGLFFDAVLALTAHYMAGDGFTMYASVVLVAIIVSRVLDRRAFAERK